MDNYVENYPYSTLQDRVFDWYKKNGRHSLPWRNVADLGVDIGYGVMVSEFMLQQTQVERVIPKYHAFLQRFPTLQDLAQAPAGDVITLWAGLGYNRRAVLLHRAAQTIVEKFKGIVPSDPSVLEAIPGFGPYTAAAVASFSYNTDCVVVDTNIERFYELLFWGHHKPSRKEIIVLAKRFILPHRSCEWHSALMDLMSLIRKEPTPLLQQKKLLDALNFSPSWSLPHLDNTRLHRPKQSKFIHSKRYYRGRIVDFVRVHQNIDKESLEDYFCGLEARDSYEFEEILTGLVLDGLLRVISDRVTLP